MHHRNMSGSEVLTLETASTNVQARTRSEELCRNHLPKAAGGGEKRARPTAKAKSGTVITRLKWQV